jgi:antitoxin HicB
MRYHFRVHKDPDGIWADCIELKGCRTQSEDGTMDKLVKNMAEVLNLYLDGNDMDISFPLPDDTISGDDIAAVPVEPAIAFAVLIRNYRLTHHLTQKEMTGKLGYKNLWSYQRLENPKSNPRLDTVAFIQNVLPDINLTRIF